MRFAALLTWLLTASLGAYMLRTWIARGGPRAERARPGGLPSPVIFGHASLAVTGLVLWGLFLGSGARPLAWAAIGCVMVAVGLGLSTVTLWTPFPARREQDGDPDGDAPAAGGESPVTDEMISRFLDDPGIGRRRGGVARTDLAVLIPVAHGFLAIATFVLAVTAASVTLLMIGG